MLFNIKRQFEKFNRLPTLTEWMSKIDSAEATAFNYEDNTKFERLKMINDITGLPYDKPESIEAKEILNDTLTFKDLMKRRKKERCAVRLSPHNSHQSRLRARGMTLEKYINIWLPMQDVNLEDHRLDILPQNTDMIYSALLLINDYGILGEIIKGIHWQLTSGIYYEEEGPITFHFDFEKWFFSITDQEIKIDPKQKQLSRALDMLIVKDNEKKKMLKEKLDAEFTSQGYLKGYFEFFVTPQKIILYNDYNRLIYKKLKDLRLQISNTQAFFKGITASPGEAVGIAKIIDNPKTQNISNGDILLCKNINIDYLPLIKKAGAIIAEQGNLLSHITIIAREIKKPYIINAINITKKIPDGSKIIVSADTGSIYFL